MAAGGPGVVNLGINASGFIGQLNAIIASTTNYNTAIGQINVQLNQFANSATNASRRLNPLNTMLRALTAYASVRALSGLASEFRSATEEAAEFSRSIGLIQTITADANMSYSEWAKGIREVSDELGQPLVQTSAAAYDLLSNQVTKAADTFGVLRKAGTLANLTNSSITSSVNSLSNVINAFGYSARDTDEIAAKLFTTVDLGRVRLNELDSTSGRVYETAKSLGVSFEEVNASLIAITQTGVRTNTSMTLVVNLLTKLLKPTKDLQEVYDKWGVGTGDVAVKMYGLAGVLKKIQEETDESTAAASKYFNEIRGKQAYDILTDQIDAFNNGLKEQATALDRAAEAKKAYESTPGFQFQKQAQELQNALTVGLRTELLQGLMKVTGAFGGLKEAGLAAMSTIATVSGGISLYTVGVTLAALRTRDLSAAWAAMRVPLVFALAGAGIAYGVQRHLERATQIKSIYDDLGDYWRKKASEATEIEARELTKQVDNYKAAMQERRAALLGTISSARQELNKLVDANDAAGAKIQDRLKNAIELALGAGRDILKEIQSLLKKAYSNVQEARKLSAGTPASLGDALYNYQQARDRAENGGQNERQIMQRRLNEINRQMAAAKKAGNLEAYNTASNKAEQLLGQASTETDHNGNLKYFGQEQALTEFYRQRRRDAEAIAATNARMASDLAKQKADYAAVVKEAESAAKEMLDLDITKSKKDGRPRFESKEELDAEIARIQKRAEAAFELLQKHPAANVGGQYRDANYLETMKILTQRAMELRQAFAEKGANTGKAFQYDAQNKLLDAAVTGVERIVNDGLKAIKDLADRYQAAFLAAGNAAAQSRQSLGALGTSADAENGKIFGNEAGNVRQYLEEEFLKYIKQISDLADKGNFKGAQAKLDEADRVMLRNRASYDKPTMVTGAADANGKLINKTPREAVNQARIDLRNREQAEAAARASRVTFDQTLKAAPAELDAMTASLKGVKDISQLIATIGKEFPAVTANLKDLAKTLETIESNAKVSAENTASENSKPTASKSAGGFAGYFAAGGEPRGIDTTLVRMSPEEFIMNPQASARFASQLRAMNAGWDPFSRSPHGPTTNVGDIHINVHGGGTSRQTIDAIATGLQRKIRQGTVRFN